MQHSENINELSAALSKAQGELRPALMDSSNPFFKSKYADLPAVWEAAREVLSKYNLCIYQGFEQKTVGNDEIITCVTILSHSSGQWMKSYLPLRLVKPGMQEVGSAITYARRYAMSALVGIVCDSEDDDGEKSMNGIERKAPCKAVEKTVNVADTPKITETQFTQLVEKCKLIDDATKENMKKYAEKNGVADLTKMPVAVWSVCMQMADNNIKMREVKA